MKMDIHFHFGLHVKNVKEKAGVPMTQNTNETNKSLDYSEIRDRERAVMKKQHMRNIVLGISGIVGFLVLWTIVVKLELIDNRLIVTPFQVVQEIIAKFYDTNPDGSLLPEHIAESLKIALSGFVLANLIGIPLGLFMGWYRNFDRFLRPLFEIIRPIPPISWIPIMIVLLGIGVTSKMVIIFFSAFVPALINSYTGIRLTNQVFINVGKTCGASNWTIFRRVGVPSALPMIFAGIKVSLGNSWSTLVAAEMLAATKGLGYLIMMGRTYARVDVIMAGMVVIGVIGIALTGLLELLEKKVIKWKM